MKSDTRLAIIALPAVVLGCFLAGCESGGSSGRITEKSAVYATLSPAEQTQIKNGGIEPGFSPDMVYMSLGKPSRISSSADGKETTWVYTNYYPPSRTPQANARMHRTAGDAAARNSTSTEAPNVSTGNGPGSSSSLSSTAATGNEPSLDIPDMPSATLHVVFTDGKLTDMSLEE